MQGSFLDTTVVINIADKTEPGLTREQQFINSNQPAETPYYALRELLAGHLRNLCDVHNIVLACDNHGEALLALTNRFPLEGRKKNAKIQILAYELDQVFATNPEGNRENIKRELIDSVRIRIVGLWRRAHNIKNVDNVQPLSCFNSGKFEIDPAGVLRGPNDSFNCLKTQRCAAAAYINDNQNDLQKLIDALDPKNLDDSIANKHENSQRRKALKDLKHKGSKFDKGRCRALGDAYFAAMCPHGSVVATSNIEDYQPLCAVLGKRAVNPLN